MSLFKVDPIEPLGDMSIAQLQSLKTALLERENQLEGEIEAAQRAVEAQLRIKRRSIFGHMKVRQFRAAARG